MSKRLRIAWFSPLNLKQAGESAAGYFSEAILPLIRDQVELELFHNSFESYQDYPTFHFLNAYQRHEKNPFDVFFYQLEDRSEANFVRLHLGLIPGVVLFHDFMYTSFGPEPILNSPWQTTLAKYRDPTANWVARGAENEQKGPAAWREAAYASVALFSNPASHLEFLNWDRLEIAEGVDKSEGSFYLPHPVDFSELEGKSPGEQFTISFVGTPRIEHRAHKVLEALSGLEGYQLLWMLDESELESARELLEEFEVSAVELIEGRSPAAWKEVARRSDVALHPFFSVYGQPGPFLAISLAAGLPVVVTNFASSEYLPDSLVFKIQPGETEALEIREVLREIVDQRDSWDRERISACAAEFHDHRSVASELMSVFENSRSVFEKVNKRWSTLEQEAYKSLLKEVGSLIGEKHGLPQAYQDNVLNPVFSELGWMQNLKEGNTS